ncbi:MAG: GspE/PulE family protein [Candidatus Absconditabacterales bacterium]
MPTTLSKNILEIDDLQGISPNFEQIKILPQETAQSIEALIFGKDKNTLKILTTNNIPEKLTALLKSLEDKGYKYEVFYTSPSGFTYALSWYDDMEGIAAQKRKATAEQKQAAGKGAIAMIHKIFDTRETMEPGDFILELIRLAFQTGASDLHFQPQEDGLIVRIRIDGVLQELLQFTHEDFKKYLQKMKFISGTKMNIDYLPQDGRFSFKATDVDGTQRKVDVRINFMPGVESESTVLRFLDPTKGISTFEKIGFTERTYTILKRNLEKNIGITIFTGPTGSGKTTTLYTILSYLNDGKRKIITLEDPIEYEVKGIQQSQINYSKGYTYEIGLKAILRHDPDIILIGETRSQETAENAINAALTGHLVFTTLHTNSAIESIPRLLSMEIKPYMLAPALNLIVAQRLVRKVCSKCGTKRDANYGEQAEIKDVLKKISDLDPKFAVPFDGKIPEVVGCEECNGSGYKGRIAVIETFEIDDDIRRMIVDGKIGVDLYAKARENGFLTLREDGIIKMLQGNTTLDEIRRVL